MIFFSNLQLLTQSLLAGTLPEECELVGSGRKKLHDVILELHEVAAELVAPVLPQLSCSLLVSLHDCSVLEDVYLIRICY